MMWAGGRGNQTRYRIAITNVGLNVSDALSDLALLFREMCRISVYL